MSASTLLDAVVDAFVAAVTGTPGATGGVFEDRQQALGVGDKNAIEIFLREAEGQTLGDNHPARSLIAVTLQIDMAIYTRSAINSAGVEESSRKLASPIWAAAHARLMADPSLGGLAARLRWKRASWRREAADGTAGWAVHTYEVSLAMREQNLLAPL